MLSKLDHITLFAPDIQDAIDNYEVIFGYPSVRQSTDTSDEFASVLFEIGETALQIVSPRTSERSTSNTGHSPEHASGHISSYSLATDNIDETHRIMKRRGLNPSEITERRYFDQLRKRFTCNKDIIKNVDLEIVESLKDPETFPENSTSEIQSLDHLVIDTPNVERAAATYGARMGFRLALERSSPEWKVHFLFFRVGRTTFEVVHRLGVDHSTDDLDQPFGFSWATKDIERTRERLASSGRNVSEIRVGRRPGSRVFTLRDRTCGIPTIFIEHEPREPRN